MNLISGELLRGKGNSVHPHKRCFKLNVSNKNCKTFIIGFKSFYKRVLFDFMFIKSWSFYEKMELNWLCMKIQSWRAINYFCLGKFRQQYHKPELIRSFGVMLFRIKCNNENIDSYMNIFLFYPYFQLVVETSSLGSELQVLLQNLESRIKFPRWFITRVID